MCMSIVCGCWGGACVSSMYVCGGWGGGGGEGGSLKKGRSKTPLVVVV